MDAMRLPMHTPMMVSTRSKPRHIRIQITRFIIAETPVTCPNVINIQVTRRCAAVIYSRNVVSVHTPNVHAIAVYTTSNVIGCNVLVHPWGRDPAPGGPLCPASALARTSAPTVGPPPLTAFLTFISRQRYIFEVINPHIVGSLTIPRAIIKWV